MQETVYGSKFQPTLHQPEFIYTFHAGSLKYYSKKIQMAHKNSFANGIPSEWLTGQQWPETWDF